MQVGRRKTPQGPAESLSAAKYGGGPPPAPVRKTSSLQAFTVAAFFFIFVMILYGDDIKSVAEISFSGKKNEVAAAADGHGLAVAFPGDRSVDVQQQTSRHMEIERSPPERATTTMGRRRRRRRKKKSSSSSPGRRKKRAAAMLRVPESCDLSKGEWVYDNASYPLYREEQCEFLTEQVTCRRNGRRDDMYQKWRWQPKDCSLPDKFDAKLFMERLRGKRFMFVGDSLNRNQWESMVCLVQSAASRKWVTWEDQRVIFHAPEYNATVEFYWAPFLVESNSDDPKIHSIQHRIIKADSIAAHGVHWKDVDFLVFNTYIWWMNTLDIKIMRPKAKEWLEYDEVERIEAYRRVIRTWAGWVDENIDPTRTSVFFISISPLHISPEAWGNPTGIRCAAETMPVVNFPGPLWLGTDWRMFDVVGNVTRSPTVMTRVPVTYLDVTTMSEYRKDGHTSVYTIRQGKLLTPEQQADPLNYADCIHWCLPGVPDTWNLMLYTRILSRPE